MAKLGLKVSAKAEDIKDSGGASFINSSDVFDVTLNFVSIEKTKNGAKQANFNITYKDNNQVIYGPIIFNKDKSVNTIGMSLINKLGVISGLEDGDDLDVEEETHKVGKENKAQDFEVITNFSGMDVKLRIQREYTRYNGEIKRGLVIRNAFRMKDGASAAEIVQDGEIGKQLQQELAKYVGVDSLRDDLTEQEVADWEEAQRAGRGSKATPQASQTAEKRSNMFG